MYWWYSSLVDLNLFSVCRFISGQANEIGDIRLIVWIKDSDTESSVEQGSKTS